MMLAMFASEINFDILLWDYNCKRIFLYDTEVLLKKKRKNILANKFD